MKRRFFTKALALFLGIIISAGAAAGQARAGVNDFVIKDYTINYSLGRDAERRSVLTTKETIVAEFPSFDQNHGIERAIPSSYDGHSTSLKITSVTDASGNGWNYSTYGSNDHEVLRIGDADKYVHGRQTFVITYTQRDVTDYFANTQRDEFYWDTNGTDWRVPIERLSVTLRLDDSLRSSLTGNTACYQGSFGATDTCTLQQQQGNVFTTTSSSLSPGQNVTMAIGFKAGTFAPYQMPLLEKLFYTWIALQVVLFIVGVGLIVWLGVRYSRRSNRTAEQHPIAPEYIPPKDASVSTAASLITTHATFAAQLIDLAVRHYLKIYQTKQKKSVFSQDEYELEIVKSIDDLRAEEKEILSDIFGDTSIGSRLEMKKLKNNTAVATRLQDNPSKTMKLVKGEYGLRHKVPQESQWFKRTSGVILLVAVLLLSPVLLIVGLVALIMGFTLHPLTDKGLALVRYIKGLKMYIGVAEEERLRMLQSPKGAARVSVDTSDGKQLLKLYERVLPYAILFGQEKEWNKQLGRYYETTGTQPDWYNGSTAGIVAFNAASFSGAISSFSASAASSSSSGGSSGGGSSGGGGGGGGGGGW